MGKVVDQDGERLLLSTSLGGHVVGNRLLPLIWLRMIRRRRPKKIIKIAFCHILSTLLKLRTRNPIFTFHFIFVQTSIFQMFLHVLFRN